MNPTLLFPPAPAPAREFLLFDRGAGERFAIDAFAVQEVLPMGRVAKMGSSATWVEARGVRLPLSDRPGEYLPVIGGGLHALCFGQGSDARVMLVGGLHGVRSSLGSSSCRRDAADPGARWSIMWPDGERATYFDHQWARPDTPSPAPTILNVAAPLALLATPSDEILQLCSRALIAASWRVREACSQDDLLALAAELSPKLVLIDPSFESGAGYAAALAVKRAASGARVALVSHPVLPLNSAMVRWCSPDWAGTVTSYEDLNSLLAEWRGQ